MSVVEILYVLFVMVCVVVIGSGIMGVGIVQVVVVVGYLVQLYDSCEGVVVKVIVDICVSFDKLVNKGKIMYEQV